jgi:hypothetical protein
MITNSMGLNSEVLWVLRHSLQLDLQFTLKIEAEYLYETFDSAEGVRTQTTGLSIVTAVTTSKPTENISECNPGTSRNANFLLRGGNCSVLIKAVSGL